MVTMKKVREYDPSKRTEYLSKEWVNGAESAKKCANIRDKILEAAKLKPRYEKRLQFESKNGKPTKRPRKKPNVLKQEQNQSCLIEPNRNRDSDFRLHW
jgi:tRNA (guanine10-N2)-methyltransferase